MIAPYQARFNMLPLDVSKCGASSSAHSRAAGIHRWIPAFAGTSGRKEFQLDELNRNPAEIAEIGMQRIAFAREHHARERAGEHDMAGFERHAMGAELVGKPGDAERRMAEHARSDPGLLDLRVAVHHAADPAQIG